MIFGMGVDMVEITRIHHLLSKHTDLSRIFTNGELSGRNQGVGRAGANSLAACFAAKEAFSKAIGTGIRGFSLNEVELLHDELGKPVFQLHGKALEFCRKEKLLFHVSVTHTDRCATAFVVAEKEN
ncbi:MAG TPA: holo-ACP synthase [Clostridia bacterium]|nr:holo-ACP synthase [Clostridia bacterium]